MEYMHIVVAALMFMMQAGLNTYRLKSIYAPMKDDKDFNFKSQVKYTLIWQTVLACVFVGVWLGLKSVFVGHTDQFNLILFNVMLPIGVMIAGMFVMFANDFMAKHL